MPCDTGPRPAHAPLSSAADLVRSWSASSNGPSSFASVAEPSCPSAPAPTFHATTSSFASGSAFVPQYARYYSASPSDPAPALLPPLADMVPIMLASCMSGMLSRIPCHPLDTIKAKMQATRLPSPASLSSSTSSAAATAAQTNTMRSVFRSTLQAEGVAGLYRGFWIAFLGSAPGGFSYFTSYEFSKAVIIRARDRYNGLSAAESAAGAGGSAPGFAVSFLAGLAAEAVSCLVWIPIDVVKERLQVQSLIKSPSAAVNAAAPTATATATATAAAAAAAAPVTTGGAPLRYSGTLHAITSILRYEGLGGLYRGYGATLASFGPFSALYLSSYEAIKDGLTRAYFNAGFGSSDATATGKREVPSWIPFLAGGLGGGISAFVTNPLDLVKLRIQIQRRAAASAANGSVEVPFGFGYRGTIHGLRTIVAQEGPKALLKGVWARVAFAAPASAVSITLFDTLKGKFTKLTKGSSEETPV